MYIHVQDHVDTCTPIHFPTLCLPQLHREGSLVRVHCSEAGQLQQPLSVLTSVEGDSGTVVSVKCREPSSVSGEERRVPQLALACPALCPVPCR